MYGNPTNITQAPGRQDREWLAGLIDPALENDINLGDHIISAAVREALTDRLGFDRVVAMPTLRPLQRDEVAALNACDAIFIGGSNLLNSRMLFNRQWALGWALRHVRPMTLLGVGWWQYQGPADLATRWLLRRLLSRQGPHSVRDGFTRKQLEGVEVGPVVNTTCPTLWPLTPDRVSGVPASKAPAVVFTLTCYNVRPETDRALLDLLCAQYQDVYFWPQGDQDMAYLNRLMNGVSVPSLRILDASLGAFDELMSQTRVDYVGTRLHGGIRALQRGQRSLILSIDNRATEIARDTGLPCVERDDLERLGRLIQGGFSTSITLPQDAIDAWCAAHAVRTEQA